MPTSKLLTDAFHYQSVQRLQYGRASFAQKQAVITSHKAHAYICRRPPRQRAKGHFLLLQKSSEIMCWGTQSERRGAVWTSDAKV